MVGGCRCPGSSRTGPPRREGRDAGRLPAGVVPTVRRRRLLPVVPAAVVTCAAALPSRAPRAAPARGVAVDPGRRRAAGPGSKYPPPPTSSRYISTTDPATAYTQGKADGQAGRRGATMLDFGRPAMSGVTSGTLDFAGHFDSDAAILTAPRSLPGARTTGVRSAPSTASVAPAPTASVRPPPHCQRHPPRRRRLGGCTGSTGPKVAAVISSLRSVGQLPAQLGAHRSSGCQRHTCPGGTWLQHRLFSVVGP